MLNRQPPSVRCFANRFEPIDNGFVFRAGPRARLIRVSIDERDGFVGDFARASRVAIWLATLALVLIIAGATLVARFTATTISDFEIFLMAAVCCCALMTALVRLWNAPARALRERAEASNT